MISFIYVKDFVNLWYFYLQKGISLFTSIHGVQYTVNFIDFIQINHLIYENTTEDLRIKVIKKVLNMQYPMINIL